MHFGTRKQLDSGAVPLQSVVLCIDCESIMDSQFEECPLCGNRSLLDIARMLGNSLPLHKAIGQTEDKNSERFDLEFAIDLKQMELRELNAAIQHITGLIGPKLVRGRARCHIGVEPVIGECRPGEKAA